MEGQSDYDTNTVQKKKLYEEFDLELIDVWPANLDDLDAYQENWHNTALGPRFEHIVAMNCAALRKKYTKALSSGSDDFPVFVTMSLLQLLAAVGAGLSVWLLAWLLAWGMRLVIRRARTKHRRMGWRRLEDELDTQIEMGGVTQSRDIE